MRILLTGFEPFGGSLTNPSSQVVRLIEAAVPHGVALTTSILPVATPDAAEEVLCLLRSFQPEAVVLLGESSRATAITLERVAINLRDYRIPDNRGESMIDQRVIDGGPDAYFATLPLRDLECAIRAGGIPVELSLSAGSYLCNEVMYAALHACATRGLRIPVGFVHLPRLPEQALERPRGQATMEATTSARAVSILLGELRRGHQARRRNETIEA